MAQPLKNGPSFHLFGRLPPELRQKIWAEAVPDTKSYAGVDLGPGLWSYTPGSWDVSLSVTGLFLVYSLSIRQLNPATAMPRTSALLLTNKEAFHIASIRLNQPLKLDKGEMSSYKHFTRQRDAIYIPPTLLNDFCDSYVRRIYHVTPDTRPESSFCIRRLAITTASLATEDGCSRLGQMILDIDDIKELVVLQQPLRLQGLNPRRPSWFRFSDTGYGAFELRRIEVQPDDTGTERYDDSDPRSRYWKVRFCPEDRLKEPYIEEDSPEYYPVSEWTKQTEAIEDWMSDTKEAMGHPLRKAVDALKQAFDTQHSDCVYEGRRVLKIRMIDVAARRDWL